MAKINILFDGTDYSIDESNLEPAKAELKTHLSSVINGSGATINFDGTAYSVDSTKLSNATNNLISYFQTITGSGFEIVINGTTYSIDSSKLNDSINALHTAFDKLQSGGSEETEDELAGTWLLNVDFVKVNDDEKSPDYIVNGYYNGLNLANNFEEDLKFKKLAIAHWTISGESKVNFNIYSELQYISTDLGFEEYVDVTQTYYSRYSNVGDIVVNNGGTNYISPDSENGLKMRTITITSKLAEVTNGDLLLAWLKANATKKEKGQTESVVGTWLFNEDVTINNYPGFTYNVDFSSYAKNWDSIIVEYDTNSDLDEYLMYYNDSGIYGKNLVYTFSPSFVRGGWENGSYRTIFINSEPTDADFIEWLKANATKQEISGNSPGSGN